MQPWHIIVLVVVLIALFGAKRLPGAARGIGQSMRIFKAEAKEMRGGGDSEAGDDAAADGKAQDGKAGKDTAEEPVKRQLQQAKQGEQKQASAESADTEKHTESQA